MPITRHFWSRQPPVDDAVKRVFSDRIGPGNLVIDVGAGYDPWQPANEYVDAGNWNALGSRMCRRVDIETDALPYDDKSVAFAYCRHTLEDLHHPFLACREMNRVALAGYIETPSPLAEFCVGVDAGSPPWRGYAHHRWLVWHENGVLIFLPKYPIFDQLKASEMDSRAATDLSACPWLWNTYLPWRDGFSFRVLNHGRDFDLTKNYADWIRRAINAGVRSSVEFANTHGLIARAGEFVATDAYGTSANLNRHQ